MLLETLKKNIASAVKKSRKERRLTQGELAKLLGITQAWYSQLENGLGSFTAEQLIVLSERLNIPISSLGKKNGADTFQDKLQKELVRLGASNLYENVEVLPSEKLASINNVIVETLVSAESSRQILALVPVIIKNSNTINVRTILNATNSLGLGNRLGWIFDGITAALKDELSHYQPRSKTRLFRKLLVELQQINAYIHLLQGARDFPEDILDGTISSEATLNQVTNSRDELAKKWKIVTRITLQDFQKAVQEIQID